jgi:PRC-barrel domain protein
MLRSIKQLYGDKLGASDGDIGHVKDFYFDDQNWVIRYLVADTGTWLPGRKVLISPHSLGRLEQIQKVLRVKLTRKQIEASPAIETHKPVSRQYEEDYYKHYGWPYYWQGDGLWGMSGFPILELPAEPSAGRSASRSSVPSPGPVLRSAFPASEALLAKGADEGGGEGQGEGGLPSGQSNSLSGPKSPDAHLRSTQSIAGYILRAGNAELGHISDFMVDAESWQIGQLVIKTGHRFSGKEVLIPTKSVNRINYDDSTVLATLVSAEIDKLPEHEAHPVGTVL